MSYKRKTSIATLALVCILDLAPKSLATSRLVSAQLYPNRSRTALTSTGLATNEVVLSQAEPLSESSEGRSVESAPSRTDPAGLVAASSSGQFLLWLLILLSIAVLIAFLLWRKRDRYLRSAQAKTEGLGQSLQPEPTPDLASTTLSQMSKDTSTTLALHESAKTSISSDTKPEETSTLISPELSAKTFDFQTVSETVSQSEVVEDVETEESYQVADIGDELEEVISQSEVVEDVETEESYQVADIGDSDSERVSESEVVEDAETQESQESYQVADIGDSDSERVSELEVVEDAETQEVSEVAEIELGDSSDEVSERDGEADENLKQATLTGGQAWVVGGGDDRSQLDVESKKFNVGQQDDGEIIGLDVDEGLPDLPGGYNQKCIVLLPRDPSWAYAYWDIGNEYREPLRQKGGKQLALRVYDVTWIDMDKQRPHSMKQYECDELTQEWYIPVPMSDRDYIVEIGYVTESGHWLLLARSESVHIPPVYPCDHYGDRFYTISWEENLRGKNI
ncbi:DUF4912 domain-containing protein [Limnospira sp.]|uniref:DUF4912 domain-containing protein n=1 Tax=Limnospira sp. TaxID=3100384 RepID=UPI003F7131F6